MSEQIGDFDKNMYVCINIKILRICNSALPLFDLLKTIQELSIQGPLNFPFSNHPLRTTSPFAA